MRTMLLAAAVAFASLSIVSSAHAQWGSTNPGAENIGAGVLPLGGVAVPYGTVAPQYIYGGGYYGGTLFGAGGGVPVYAGYRGYSPYGYRVYGRGRTFGSYQPRFYPTYQPRRFGMFDR
jgi:hypothetical protein